MKWRTPAFWQYRVGIAILLYPVSLLFRMLVWCRRASYRYGLSKSYHAEVPVIVVGNLTVGGAGKTPLVIAIVNHLKNKGRRVGVVSRGYGGSASGPILIRSEDPPSLAGDEAVVLARRTGVPVVIGADRGASVRQLIKDHACSVIVCDDGLQHYKLARDMEICVIDGTAGLGNRWCLPAGPLREPVARLRQVDLIVYSGVKPEVDLNRLTQALKLPVKDGPARARYHMQIDSVVNLCDQTVRRKLSDFKDQPVHAVAAIGRPDKFFCQLRDEGITVVEHAFADHHIYRPSDLDFNDALNVLMTEKDSVKCEDWARSNFWYVGVSAQLDEATVDLVNSRVKDFSASA